MFARFTPLLVLCSQRGTFIYVILCRAYILLSVCDVYVCLYCVLVICVLLSSTVDLLLMKLRQINRSVKKNLWRGVFPGGSDSRTRTCVNFP